jgi:hypothetical protein
VGAPGELELSRQLFLQRHAGAYGYRGRLPAIRAEFPALQRAVYLDHAAATLYSRRQLRSAFDDLSSHLYGNPHSQLGPQDRSAAAVERLKALTLQVPTPHLQSSCLCPSPPLAAPRRRLAAPGQPCPAAGGRCRRCHPRAC